jgi:flagellar protein FlgJ
MTTHGLNGVQTGLAVSASSSQGISLAAGGGDAAKQAKLASAAREFEAMMVNELMKPLKFGQAESTEEGADETGGGAGDIVRGFATEAMSKALAANGGFGLAKQIVQQVSNEHDRRIGKGQGTKVWEANADTPK